MKTFGTLPQSEAPDCALKMQLLLDAFKATGQTQAPDWELHVAPPAAVQGLIVPSLKGQKGCQSFN